MHPLMIPMGDWGLDRALNQYFFFGFGSLIMVFLGQEDKSLLENIHFSQNCQASKIQKFQQNPKQINENLTLILVSMVDRKKSYKPLLRFKTMKSFSLLLFLWRNL